MSLSYNIIPRPNVYEHKSGTYSVSSGTAVICHKDFTRAGTLISLYLHTDAKPGEGTIKINKENSIAPEGYRLKVSEDEGIVISASDPAGAFYGAVTLEYILKQCEKRNGKAIINALYIGDSPYYKQRGFMLDCSRNFFDVDEVKRYIDRMSHLKLNTFHWHLCDDQGYRIESKMFPKLNEISSKRAFQGLEGFGLKNRGEKDYKRFYTHKQIRDIVEYAERRFIDVIPEIDMPGHTSAILAAYPELSCTKEKHTVLNSNGVKDASFCPGDEKTYEFIEKLLDEVVPLFKSKYFHLGGDEVFKCYKDWEKCPKCQAVAKTEDCKNMSELHSTFLGKVSKILKKHGKTAITWSDAINRKLPNDVMCQYWRLNDLKKIKSKNNNRKIIISPMNYFYFDSKYSFIPLRKVYKYNNVKLGMKEDDNRILGIECEVWTEFIDNEKALEFSLFPRVFAFAEVSWTKPERRNYKDFLKRLKWYEALLDKKGINRSITYGCQRFPRMIYHLGSDGKEYQKNEILKAKLKI